MRNIFNFLLFQIQWILCVFNIKHGFYYALGIFLIQCIFLCYKKNYLKLLLVLILSLLGISVDTALMQIGVFIFPGWEYHYIIPSWLLTLWFCFSLWFVRANYINQKLLAYTMLCAIFGPWSYYIGMKLGALNFGINLIDSLIFLGLSWLILGILFISIHKLLLKKST